MSSNQSDYSLLDSGNGKKFERFGNVTLVRPCAQAVWQPALPATEWARATASFDREDGNRWEGRGRLPDSWNIRIDGLAFKLSGTNFGHLGIFPEQRAQWQWIQERISKVLKCESSKVPTQPSPTGDNDNFRTLELSHFRTSPQVLNLFAYSGGATMAAALGGAAVCHLDASKGMVQWARENAALNNLHDRPIRWIDDDAHKFLHREIRRGNRYDAIILDPPTFGRGQNNEMYKIERDLPETLSLCKQLLSPTPLFILISAHTPGFSPTVLQNVLGQTMGNGHCTCGEMLLTGAEGVLPTPSGTWARWTA